MADLAAPAPESTEAADKNTARTSIMNRRMEEMVDEVGGKKKERKGTRKRRERQKDKSEQSDKHHEH